MRACCLLALGSVWAVAAPASAEPEVRSYTLPELRSVAREVHPTIESAAAGLEVAAGALRQAHAYPNPLLVATAGRGRPRDGGDARTEATLELLQPIERPSIRRWRVHVAELGVSGAEIERAITRSLVDSAVSRLALTVIGSRRRVEISRDGARIAERLHDLLEQRAELGESAPLEAVRARAEWFARRRDVLDAESQLAAARSSLNLFCAGRLGGTYEVLEPPRVSPIPDLPSDLVERLATRNPILLRAGVAAEEGEARTRMVRKESWPGFDVLAGYETELDRTAATVGLGLSIPVWNRNRGAIDTYAAEARRARLAVQTIDAELRTELASTIAEHERAREAIGLHRDGWDATAGKALAISTFRFENGEGSLLDVLDAQRAHLEVGLDEAETWLELQLARLEIERLIGGPLREEATDEAP